jgi:hypothetical protein
MLGLRLLLGLRPLWADGRQLAAAGVRLQPRACWGARAAADAHRAAAGARLVPLRPSPRLMLGLRLG